ncbi:hypothetical protein [Wukongibacter sp. M2B1]|uniref:hypothetical protein n=1 Tax=Wukongibacter sp. M2B1 TaxID=3088895 RepID=UPI003D790515
MKIKLELEKIGRDLTELCVNIGDRYVGSQGNQRSTNYVSKRLASKGFKVACTLEELSSRDFTDKIK